MDASSPLYTRQTPFLFRCGEWLRQNRRMILAIQWVVITLYFLLIVIPTFLPLPGPEAHIWSNVTLAAQFVFWGIWWPFVLISMGLFGRIWCGVLCPEGALTEFASKYSLNRPIPKWMRWGGWPFVAFAGTTIYGQMVSVYQYPKAVMLVLGGSTVAAIIIGLIYVRERRVWCRYLCPVNGVFELLAKLAPVHFRTDQAAWQRNTSHQPQPQQKAPTCAPLLPLAKLNSASSCHACGRCSGYKNAIALAPRASSEEITKHGFSTGHYWQSALLIVGVIGLAMGAFHWSSSPWFVAAKQSVAEWLIDRNILWPLDSTAPWWLLTHYPENNDALSWLDGGLMLSYILLTAAIVSVLVGLPLVWAASRMGKPVGSYFNHLAQALIPLGGCGVFLGLSATTVAMLRAEHLSLGWVSPLRLVLLAGATAWTMWLAFKIAKHHRVNLRTRLEILGAISLSCLVIDFGWALMFWIW